MNSYHQDVKSVEFERGRVTIPRELRDCPGPLDQRRREHVAHLERELESIVEQLRVIKDVQKVILFGSWARNRRDLGSDLDLIVVMDSALDFVSRSVDVAMRLHTGAPLDLLVYTPEEVERMAKRPFLRQALQEGIVLYAR